MIGCDPKLHMHVRTDMHANNSAGQRCTSGAQARCPGLSRAPDAVPHVLHVAALADALQDGAQVLQARRGEKCS
jgi:hypothetical protein